ncbi:MAG: hypothetical protein EOP49_52410, partial [Sphingobacteriales bacterium]
MSRLRDKMLNYEADPPRETWEKIAAALDESLQGNQFPARLHTMEVNPPAFAWEKIASSLNSETTQEAVVINQPSRFRNFLRYAAAAVIIGAVALGILQWTGSYKSTTGTAVASAPADSGKSNLAAATPADTQKTSTGSSFTSPENPEPDRRLIAKLDVPVRNNARKLNSGIQSAAYPATAKASSAIYQYNDHVPFVADRYIMLMTPDGQIMETEAAHGTVT